MLCLFVLCLLLVVVVVVAAVVVVVVVLLLVVAASSSSRAGAWRRPPGCRPKKIRRCAKKLDGGYVLCTMHYVLCTMYYVLCIMYYVLLVLPFVILRIVRPRIGESTFRNYCAKKLDGALRKSTSFV